VARGIAAQLSTRLDKPVVIENVGGAGGLIGTEMAAKAPPDGYTLILISVAFAFNPSIYKLPYDPATAFVPVAILGAGPVVIAVTSKLPVGNLKELLALAREKPGSLNYATAGVGSFQHLASELFKQQAGIDIVHVPFKGGGPAMMDVIAGNTQIAVGSLVQMLPQIKGGKLKALGVGSAARIPALPDVPTISEAGVPGFEVTNWWGICFLRMRITVLPGPRRSLRSDKGRSVQRGWMQTRDAPRRGTRPETPPEPDRRLAFG